jgi:GAF domain-containing protein
LAALHSLRLLDTPPEERFDRLTRIASKLFNAPISLITLVDEDRQWFKSRVGLELGETPRHMSFCSHAVADDAPLIVHDALQDKRFAQNPLVVESPRIRFYAGVPVHVNAEPVGTLCLIDTKPRAPSADELQLLKDLASLVQSELDLGAKPAATSTSSVRSN